MSKKKRENYINNKEFSIAVKEYVEKCNDHKEKELELPVPSEYIGNCFLKIAYGLAKKPNFSSYSYKDEMIMDAVENCVKAIENFKIDAPTRSGIPNAFAYFTQISYWAMVRRIKKEKKQENIRNKFAEQSSISQFMDGSENDNGVIETIKNRNYNRKKDFYNEDSIIE